MVFNKDILFVHVPKTAGMSITHFLLHVLKPPIYISEPMGQETEVQRDGVIHIDGTRHEFLDDAKRATESRGFRLENFKVVVAVMRCPYELELSRYFYLQLGYPWDRGQAQKVAMSSDFETFACEARFHGRENPELERYFLVNGAMPKNLHIIKYEELESCLRKVVEALNIRVDMDLPRINVSREVRYNFMDYLTPVAEEAIYRKYKWFFDIGMYRRVSLAGRNQNDAQ